MPTGKLYPLLFQPVSNAPLVLFRVLFGLLIFLEAFGAILTGWVRQNLVEPSFSFTFIGFEWLNVLIGPQMYAYFGLMAVWGIMVMLGYRYRFAMLAFSIMWLGAYLLQKTSYNNHYYLLVWVNFLMFFLPAHKNLSLDVKYNRVQRQSHMYNWHRWAPVVLMSIAYVYGSVAKIYPDWLDATFIRRAFTNRYENPTINGLFSASWFHYFISYTGILFDGGIAFALLYKRTRLLALIASFVFHLFNSIVFQIGIFPYMSLGFILFFYPPEVIRNRFLAAQQDWSSRLQAPIRPKLTAAVLLFFLAVHLLLPLRHWTINSNVFWTEEGHRMSWRMMLRSKSGSVYFRLEDKA
ncbi:MAG: HTTM domain-containing protein, partial [Schleiferiaceae bacterium]|nr:HTTM domain-containing protein [Schleiferiaceae bacterium]